MGRELTDVIAALVLPPASPLLLIIVGAALAWRRRFRGGAALVALGVVLLWLACLPAVGLSLVRWLEPAPASEASLAGAQAIVVLGAGRIEASPEYEEDVVNTEALGRLRYAARLARKSGLPILVAGGKPYGGRLSEGDTMARVLDEDFRVPARWIESDSHTTAQNAAGAFALLEPEGRTRIALVTSAVHLRRAALAFRKAGFDVIPAPSVYLSRHDARLLDWVPSAAGLGATRAALWEMLGMVWYRLRGVG